MVDNKTSVQQKVAVSRTSEKRMSPEQITNHDEDARDGTEQEAEVTICLSPDSKSSGKKC
jgi:hypothetical protein